MEGVDEAGLEVEDLEPGLDDDRCQPNGGLHFHVGDAVGGQFQGRQVHRGDHVVDRRVHLVEDCSPYVALQRGDVRLVVLVEGEPRRCGDAGEHARVDLLRERDHAVVRMEQDVDCHEVVHETPRETKAAG